MDNEAKCPVSHTVAGAPTNAGTRGETRASRVARQTKLSTAPAALESIDVSGRCAWKTGAFGGDR